MRLRTQVLLLQLAVIAVSLGVGFGIVVTGADDRIRDEYAQRALAIAQTMASDPDVIGQVAAHQGTAFDHDTLVAAPLQQQAVAVTRRTGALFVVIANADGIRLAHPDPAEVGVHVSTDPSTALSGDVDITTDRGTLGESVRAKVPIFVTGSPAPVGLVSVGISTAKLASDTRHAVGVTVSIALAALGVGALGSLLLARRWRRLTLGLEPDDLAELVREQRAVLHSLGDGVLAVDPSGVVRVANTRARTLLGLERPVGRHIDTLGLTPRVRSVLDVPTADPVAATIGDNIILLSSHHVVADGRDLGMVMSIVDRTDVEELAREVDSIRVMSTALRAQRHETANRMHVLAGLLRHGHVDEASVYLDELTGTGAGGAIDGIENVDEPHLQAFLEAKAAHARERGVGLRLGPQTWVEGRLTDAVTVTAVVGNLLDNAIDAAAGSAQAEVEVEILTDATTMLITVADSGPGIAFERPDDIFAEGVTTKRDPAVPGGRGMGLAVVRQLARRIGGDVVVADPGGNLGGAVLVARLPGVIDDPAADDPGGHTDTDTETGGHR
ncbi:sensor histidine kinase [Gordonia sp. NB41Y]|uniref:sensor histidine kinase n=1 Tax=Gordonia sp. NB41Y TaxID=875808 RepID=UPI0006B1E4E0|nr:sensor histidine kinase [Gordonia sp. NB41Y]KOY49594.1 histidine kinase [Gordonia sp. NB41Y]WLP88585.1 sensor histidine kinase [Gordonia sp. NB41Y]